MKSWRIPEAFGQEHQAAWEVVTPAVAPSPVEAQGTALVLACSEPVIAERLLPRLGPWPLHVWRSPGPLLAAPKGSAADLESMLEKTLEQHDVREIVVCGHTGCRWLKRLWEGWSEEQGQDLSPAAAKLREAVRRQAAGGSPDQTARTLAEQHVAAQIEHLKGYPAVVRRLAEGALRLHAWIFDEQSAALYGRGPAGSPLLAWLRRAASHPQPWEPVFDPCKVYLA